MAKLGRLVKESMADEISSRIAGQPGVIVTSMRKLRPIDSDALRNKLHTSKAHLRIIKRTLGVRVLDGLKIDGAKSLAETKNGAVALIIAQEDASLAAKQLVDFIKDHEDQLIIQGGLLDGKLLDRKSVEALAALPPRPVLLAELVGALEAPAGGFIALLEQALGDFTWVLEKVGEKRPEETTKS